MEKDTVEGKGKEVWNCSWGSLCSHWLWGNWEKWVSNKQEVKEVMSIMPWLSIATWRSYYISSFLYFVLNEKLRVASLSGILK